MTLWSRCVISISVAIAKTGGTLASWHCDCATLIAVRLKVCFRFFATMRFSNPLTFLVTPRIERCWGWACYHLVLVRACRVLFVRTLMCVAVAARVVINLLVNLLFFVFIQCSLIDQLCRCLPCKHRVACRYFASIFGSALTNWSESAVLWEILGRPTPRQSHSCYQQ